MSRRCRSALLADHRSDLVGERTRIQNRLRWHLLELCGELEQTLLRGALNKPRHIDRVDQRLRRLPPSARTRVAREQITHLRVLNRQIGAIGGELLELVAKHRPQLLNEAGCGPLTAAILIGRTAGAERFRSDASFARQAGVAPILASSGQRDRHRLHRGGDRQLNHALHIIFARGGTSCSVRLAARCRSSTPRAPACRRSREIGSTASRPSRSDGALGWSISECSRQLGAR